MHRIVVTATNSSGASASKTVELMVAAASSADAPRILTVGDGDQALAVHAETARLASVPNARFDGQPAHEGDVLLVAVSDMNCAQPAQSVLARFGNSAAPVLSLDSAGDTSTCRVAIRVPEGIAAGRTPMSLEVATSGGGVLASNTVTIATEN